MDLIEEYFKRDLTEEEEDLLSRTLASSPEKAELFGQRMAEFYKKDLGLEAPAWPETPFSPAGRRSAWFLWVLLFLLLGGGSLLFMKFRSVLDPAATVPVEKPSEGKPALSGPKGTGPKTPAKGTPQAPKETPVPAQPVTAKVQVLDAQGNLVEDLPGIPVPVLSPGSEK